jgi:pyruvate dehydrogenase E2 component (dihydrolipoamide acetyltransferase)
MSREFRLPDLGEGITEGQIVRVLCKPGDQIQEDQAILEVETDKAAVEIPSPFAGVADKIHVEEGQTVAVGEVLVTFNGEAGSAGAAPKAESTDDKSASKDKTESKKAAPEDKPSPSKADDARPQRTPPSPAPTAPAPSAPAPAAGSAPRRTRAAAAPAVRKFARESGVDIDTLTGSGPGGRVLRSDVEAALAGSSGGPSSTAAGPGGSGSSQTGAVTAPAPAPVVSTQTFEQLEGRSDRDNWGTVKRSSLTQIRKTIAKQMVKSVSTIPHVTQTDEADVTVLDAIRRDLRGEDGSGPRVTMMAFILKTLAHCLREHPIFNASYDDASGEIIYKQYINIGIAVDSPRGLVVPVIRDVDRLSVLGIAQELVNVAQKVRDVQFGIDDLRGGSFTVTNYGAIGGIWGTPIINHPEVAILGIGRTQERLVLEDEELIGKQMLPLSISFDHRATDGAQAARFLNDVVAHLSNPGLLLIK